MKEYRNANLHTHTEASNFRLLDSTNKLVDVIEYAHKLGMSGIAITEHDTIESSLEAIEFYYSHKDLPEWKDFKVALGNEIYLCPNNITLENGQNGEHLVFPHFILIALDAVGHEQIRELSTIAWKQAFMWKGMMRVPTYYDDLFEIVGKNPGHVIASTACLGGSIPRQLLSMLETSSDDEKNFLYNSCKQWISVMKDLFGKDNFYLELQPSNREEQHYVNKMLIQLASDTDTPYIITTDAHYLTKDDRAVHKLFLNSDDGDREVDDFYETTYLMDEAEIHSYLDAVIGHEKVEKAFQNSNNIINRVIPFDLRKPLKIPYVPVNTAEPNMDLVKKYSSQIPLLEKFAKSEYASDRHLVRDIVNKMEVDEYCTTPKAIKEINNCFSAVDISSDAMNVRWSAYLEQIAIYVNMLWDNDIMVGASRGSGLGFIFNYMLGITQINPCRETTQTYYWRFLNPERTSVLDIDVDIPSSKRDKAIQAFKNVYGDKVSKVLTITRVQSRSAILTACRGLEIESDIAQYISSLIVADRGQPRDLHTMYYGNDDVKPVYEFRNMMDMYPDLWDLAQKIEGLITGVGSHAGGVVMVEKPFTKYTALMRTNNGDLVTQFDLHKLEDVSLIKVDLLSIDALDKIESCLKLLLKDNVIQWQDSLRATYEKYVGIYNLERNDLHMWEKLWNHEVLSLFQMEKESGIQAISLVKPTSVDDLAVINSAMRLMASEGATETPLEKFARYKADISLWYKEMDEAGLTKEEQALLEPIVGGSYGICEAQEVLMQLVMIPECGGFSLRWADSLRKSVAKKNPKLFMELEKEYLDNMRKKNLSENLCKYVWFTLIYTQRGYGFNRSHTLSYSLIGLQELNLAYKYNPLYWSCAVLISDSGSLEDSEKSTNYGKISTAIATLQKNNVEIALPLLNEAERQFIPKVQQNRIIFSLKAISGIGDDVVQLLIDNRPYSSIEDFYTRMFETKLITKAQMITLIKAGAFTEIHDKDRVKTMEWFLNKIYAPKTKLTMQNFKMITENNLLPEDLHLEFRVYNFKNYVLSDKFLMHTVVIEGKKVPKCGYHDRLFRLDNISMPFFKENFTEDSIQGLDGENYIISEKLFVKECNAKIDRIKEWLNSSEALNAVNNFSMKELFHKYAEGTVSHWEMQSLCCYYSEHELSGIDNRFYGVVDFFNQPETPTVYDTYERWFTDKDGHKQKKIISKYTIVRLAGTVLDKDNNKHTITILTTSGVVKCKLPKGQYAFYNKRVSAYLNGESKKTVIDDSWFKRGTLLLICGYRQDSDFRVYRYSDSIYQHSVMKIEQVLDNGKLQIKTEREKV